VVKRVDPKLVETLKQRGAGAYDGDDVAPHLGIGVQLNLSSPEIFPPHVAVVHGLDLRLDRTVGNALQFPSKKESDDVWIQGPPNCRLSTPEHFLAVWIAGAAGRGSGVFRV
jgi:hypothetical protein